MVYSALLKAATLIQDNQILTKQAQQKKGTPLGEKKPINHYASFQKRLDALLETLMVRAPLRCIRRTLLIVIFQYQKTVCKHLIEPPYSYSVVDDPQNARDVCCILPY